jgi:hypothetical protein
MNCILRAAGLIMPFMNVFFRAVHHQPAMVIGTITLHDFGDHVLGVFFGDVART